MKIIDMKNDFSATPIGRYNTDSEFSGEKFRDELLLPALQNNDEVQINFDGIEGCGSSFLEEVFGGIVRNNKKDAKTLLEKLKISTSDNALKKEIISYINDAAC